MATAFVQSVYVGNNADGTVLTTAGITTTTGNLLIATFGHYATSAVTIAITDSNSNTWTAVSAKYNGVIQTFYAKNITGGASHTVTATLSGNREYRRLAVHEVSGADTTAPFDQTANASDGVGTTVTVGPVTTTTDGQYIYAVVLADTGDDGFNANSPYTERGSVRTGSLLEMQTQDTAQASAGSISSTWTSGYSGTTCDQQMATFKATAAGNPWYIWAQS